MSMLLDKTIRLFLDSIGRREEYEYYLERFALGGQSAFALIVPDYEGFSESASVFVFDLTFLLRLGLHPVVLLCGEHTRQMSDLMKGDAHPFVFLPLAETQNLVTCQTRLQEIANAGKIAVFCDSDSSLEAALPLIVPQFTKRIHMIRASGPLHQADGKPLSYYQTQNPVPLLPEEEWLVQIATGLFDQWDGLHISIASPLNLLAELFTVKGAGCLIRRGARISCYNGIATLDRDRLVALLKNSFGRDLVRPGCLEEAACIYVDDNYRCAAMLEPHQDYMYLSKFAVHREARGEGLGQELWRTIGASYQSIFWRSRIRNPFNQWYERQADGAHTEGDWRVYWRGIARRDIPSIIAAALKRPLDLAADSSV